MLYPMEYTEITYEVDGPAAVITLHRPDRMNAFTFTMMRELVDAFDRVDADDAGRAFCAGADLGAGGATFDLDAQGERTDGRRAPRDAGGVVTLRIFECTKP